MTIDEKELAERIADMVTKQLQECLSANNLHSDFYIPEKTHYDSHQRLDHFFQMLDETGSWTRKIVVSAIILFLIGATAIGIGIRFASK
jgi:hypothetical protein